MRLFDFGLAVFNNAQEQLARGTGPYFYLPKLESHEEARLWARAFGFAEQELEHFQQVADYLAQVERLGLHHVLAAEHEQLTGQAGSAVGG